MKKTVKIVLPILLGVFIAVVLLGSLVTTRPNEYTIVKQFGKVVYDAMVKFYNGELEFGKHTSCDVSSGYLEMLETKQFEKIVKEGMPDVYKRYTEICQDLKDGKIEVGTAVGATPEYVAQKKAEAAAH